MIRPAQFGSNQQTADSNKFQQRLSAGETIHDKALQEFNQLQQALSDVGVTVNVIDDTPQPPKPDAVFPNNWVSFHADGTTVLYPMMAVNRRYERRVDVVQQLHQRGYHVHAVIDFALHEAANQFLEGTGSLVLDRVHRMAYACLSPRTDIEVLGEFAQRLDYELVVFNALDAQGQPVYHTNVLMSIGSRFAVICSEAIAAHERAAVLHALQSTGHEVIDITMQQMYSFAGNLLELRNQDGEAVIALSQTALDSLSSMQLKQLKALGGQLVTVAIPTIEKYGGGSVRCMIAEVFLPRTS